MPSSEFDSARPGGELSKIPEERRDGVHTALRTVFGSKRVGEMQPIIGGVSGAMILRFEVGGRSYVLRLEPERIALHNRQRGFTCMTVAAAVAVAPPVHYADPATGVAVMDYVARRLLSEHPGGPAGLVQALGALSARLQAAAPFPVLDEYPQMIGAMLTALDESGHFAPNSLKPHLEGLASIRAALPWDASSLVPSHNDPNPRNILFDGERLWLIDWELAFSNDPLVDVAILSIEFAETPELEDALLKAALGRAPDQAIRARLKVMRLLARLFYGGIVLENFIGMPQFSPDASLDAFTQASFRSAVAGGQLTSGAPETAYAFGKMSLAAFIDGLAAPRFDELLEMVRQG